jgi:prepilin-type processing-associated H-X9-DG protein
MMPLKRTHLALVLAGGLLAVTAGVQAATPDWSKVPKRTIQVFHAGVTPMEWITKKGAHGGGTGLRKGESCAGCHEDAGELNFDFARLATKELEPVGGAKTMMFPVAVQAAYDADHLYMRLTFKAPADAAAEAPREAQSPKHELKAAVMFVGSKVPMANQVGCWATCHDDVRSMPGANKDKKKYITGANLADDTYTDYMQWKSGEGGAGALFLDGHVAEARVDKDGKALVSAEGVTQGGETTVTFIRKLTGAAGDIPMAEGKAITFGIAIHTDRTVYRFHHVSLNYTLGLGADGDVKAVKQ